MHVVVPKVCQVVKKLTDMWDINLLKEGISSVLHKANVKKNSIHM